MKTCKLCYSPDTKPLHHTSDWRRCNSCGSDSAEWGYGSVTYDRAFEQGLLDASGGHAGIELSVSSNCEWFGPVHGTRDFLDIGCNDGASLTVMQRQGWRVHGFDVFAPSYIGPHVTVRPHFNRWWFPRQYQAVQAREVFEHVESPDAFLHECWGVCVPGGLFQIQTPRTLEAANDQVYQLAHLFIVSPDRLRFMLNRALFDIIGERHWDTGQAYLCRARG